MVTAPNEWSTVNVGDGWWAVWDELGSFSKGEDGRIFQTRDAEEAQRHRDELNYERKHVRRRTLARVEMLKNVHQTFLSQVRGFYLSGKPVDFSMDERDDLRDIGLTAETLDNQLSSLIAKIKRRPVE